MAKTAPPDDYSLGELYTDLVEHSGDNVGQKLRVLKHRLLDVDGDCQRSEQSQDAQKLFSWVATTIKPLGDILVRENPQQIEDLVSMSRTAFECMQQLQNKFLSHENANSDALLSIIAYTDVEDPWTLEATQRAAEQVLRHHQAHLKTHEFVIEHTLVGFIRPLFSDSRTTSVTSQGRKAISHTMQKPHSLHDPDESKNLWKVREISAMTVLRWTIRNMDESMFQKNWHLCIPPLLTLLDDSSTVVRVRGLHILSDLLERTPSKLLQQTGLGEVFEDAVMPTLLFLPELTPIEDSISLLTSAYLALSSLGEVLYTIKEEPSKKTKFLDRIMRQGVLQGFIHSGDHVKIVELLFKEVIILFNNMGIHAVKYLKDIIPMLSKILTDPFGPSHPRLLLTAAKATQSTVINCWPRMTESIHRIELVKALTLCWTTVNGEMEAKGGARNPELEAVKDDLQLAGNTLFRAVSGNSDMTDELQLLLDVDPSLDSLFGINVTQNKK